MICVAAVIQSHGITLHSTNNIFQLCWEGGLGVFALKMLFVCLGVWHARPAYSTAKLQPSCSCLGIVVLVASLLLLQLGLSFFSLGLRLLSLESTSHLVQYLLLLGHSDTLYCGYTLKYDII